MNSLKLTFLLLTAVASLNNIIGQNLVPNPSFERINDCPDDYAQLSKAIGWTTPLYHGATPDLYNDCSSSPHVTLPINSKGSQYPHSGDGLVGMYLYTNNQDETREYIEIELVEALEKDKVYDISFYYSLAESSKWSTNSFGIYLSENRVIGKAGSLPLNVTPQLQNNIELDDMLNWTEISFMYTAMGKEKHMILGNFNDNAHTPINEQTIGMGLEHSYIYIDDVSIQERECELFVDLGHDQEICKGESILLDAENPNAQYKWQDGSKSSSFEVIEPGLYKVEVSNDFCSVSDEVIVKAVPIPNFSLGKDTVVCLGEPFELKVSGSQENYKWQDESYGPSYTVIHPGQFWAELDYECGTVRKEVVINSKNCNCRVYIPNSFTPNDDEINNEFSVIPSCDLEEFNLKIFNRWGDEIFESHRLSEAWTGDLSQNDQMNTRYQYVVRYRFKESTEINEVQGSVLVVK